MTPTPKTALCLVGPLLVGTLTGCGGGSTEPGKESTGWSLPNPFPASPTKPPFPAVETAGLAPSVVKHLQVLQREYANPGEGTKYAQGVREPWCADFVSWTLQQAGSPLKNPNSGSWRIPGTMTLLDHLRSEGRWRSATSGYSPKTGDIVIYDTSSPWGQHTNVVLSYRDGKLTTIGGNQPRPEASGTGISIDTRPLTPALKIMGYGVAPTR